jgi:hypothetical protein
LSAVIIIITKSLLGRARYPVLPFPAIGKRRGEKGKWKIEKSSLKPINECFSIIKFPAKYK